jgi:GGDEF domain-containing protein
MPDEMLVDRHAASPASVEPEPRVDEPTTRTDPESSEPRSWAELHAAVNRLTLRAQTGGAEQVLDEIDRILQAARDAGARRIVHRVLYVTALCNLRLNRLDECLAASYELTRELSDDPVDRGWLSSSASMRALVSEMRSDRSQALESLIEAAIHLQAAPQRSPGYLNAVNGLGVGYLAIRLYEPALEQYQRPRDDELFAQFRVSGMFRVLNAQLAHLYWGLELDRIGSSEARDHFAEAMALGEQAKQHLPASQDRAMWESLLEARSGLCLAFLDEPERAIERLEPVLEPLARHDMDEAVMARLGLVRALAELDRTAALAQSERALLSVAHTTDYAPSLGVAWEHARLHLDDTGAQVAAEYARLLAQASWDERTARAEAVAERVAVASARRAEAKDTERLLYDAATGLPNRLSFVQRLAGDVAEANRTGSSVGVALLDLPDGAFDELLDEVVATLAVDFLARIGPSELAAIGVGLDATQVARRIEDCAPAAAARLIAGVASLQAPPSVTGLVVHADEALLTARKTGGVVVNPFSSNAGESPG